jgi:hypothetical protein
LPFSGEFDGRHISAHAPNLLPGLEDCSGVVSSSGLKLFFPLVNGQTSIIDFARASAETWNTTVTLFQQKCRRAFLTETWREAIQAHFSNLREAVSGAQNNIPRLTQQKADANNRLDQANGQMKAAQDVLKRAHKRRDWLAIQAKEMAEISDQAQAASDGKDSNPRGYLGISIQEPTQADKDANAVVAGQVVASIEPGGPAASSVDIRPGDLIVRVGQFPIVSQIDFLYAMVKTPPGTTLEIERIRAGQHQTLNVTCSKPPELSDTEAMTRANQLSYASSQADYQVSQGDYGISQAEYQVQQAQYAIDQANQNLSSIESQLASANQVMADFKNEATILQAGKAFVKKLIDGSLWLGKPEKDSAITQWPRDNSKAIGHLVHAQPVYVVPVDPDWCMVVLADKGLGWARRSNLTITSG